jgi:hypothetical protein
VKEKSAPDIPDAIPLRDFGLADFARKNKAREKTLPIFASGTQVAPCD